METKRVEFLNANDKKLSGKLDIPDDGVVKAYAIFAHCFTCSKDLKAARNIAKALTSSGIAVLRFDFTGLGQSGGEFGETTLGTNIMDIEAAAEYLKINYSSPTLLIGHSFGGTAVLYASKRIKSIHAVAVIGTPSKTDHVLRHIKDSVPKIQRDGVAMVDIGGRPFPISNEFISSISSEKLYYVLNELDMPLLIIHSQKDRVVQYQNGIDLFNEATQPKSFITLLKANHLLTKEHDAKYVGGIIASWASYYIAPIFDN